MDYYEKVEALCQDFDNNFSTFKHDVMENGFYLFAGNFPGISYNDFITDFIRPYEERFEINLIKKCSM